MAIQQLIFGVLLPGFVHDSMQHFCVVPTKRFFLCGLLVSIWPFHIAVLTDTVWKKSCFILSDSLDFHFVDSQCSASNSMCIATTFKEILFHLFLVFLPFFLFLPTSSSLRSSIPPPRCYCCCCCCSSSSSFSSSSSSSSSSSYYYYYYY